MGRKHHNLRRQGLRTSLVRESPTILVLINSNDGKRVWGAVGVGENIIEASWQALVDGLEYGVNNSGKE